MAGENEREYIGAVSLAEVPTEFGTYILLQVIRENNEDWWLNLSPIDAHTLGTGLLNMSHRILGYT